MELENVAYTTIEKNISIYLYYYSFNNYYRRAMNRVPYPYPRLYDMPS